MTEFLALFIPVFAAGILLFIFKHKTTWWEVLLPLIAGIIIIFSMRACDKAVLVEDNEYLSYYGMSVHYEEPWNEYIHKTCYYTTCTGSGKSRVCTTHSYDCSYVKYHDAEYYIKDNGNNIHYITEKEYKKYRNLWGNNNFVEMNRNYHTIDGNMYVSVWNKDTKTMITTQKNHSYTNKVQASHSIYNFKEIDEEEKIKYKLFDYPEITSYNINPILTNGYTVQDYEQRSFNVINGLLGSKKHVQVLLLIWKNKPLEVSEMQKAYWKGGNQNELIICIGLDNNNNIKWNNIFTWSEKDIVKIKIRDYLYNLKGKKLYIGPLKNYVMPVIDKHWVRKDFKEFDYLEVELTYGQIIWIFIVVLIVTVGLSIFVIMNEVDPIYKESTPNQKLIIFKQKTIQNIKRLLYLLKTKTNEYYTLLKNKFKKQ